MRREWARTTRPSTSDVGTSLSLPSVDLMDTYIYPSCVCASSSVAGRRDTHLSRPLLTNHSYSFPGCSLINLLDPIEARPICPRRLSILFPLISLSSSFSSCFLILI